MAKAHLGKREIGTGLLAVTGIAAGYLLQVTFPHPSGLPLLLSWAVVAGAAGSAIWLLRHNPDRVEAERREKLRTDLGRFMMTAAHLRRAMADMEHEPSYADADRWLEELCGYLEENLGVSYVARVNDGSSVPTGLTSLDGQRRDYDSGLRIRLFHLDQFCRELA